MFRGLLFIVFIVNIRTSSCAIEALYEAGQRVWKLYAIIDNTGSDILHGAEAIEHLNDNPIIREMKKQVDEIHDSLYVLEKFMGPKKILNEIESWPLNALIIRDFDMIEIFVQRIDEYYKKFHQYRNDIHRSDVSFEVLRDEIFQALPGEIGTIRKFAYEEKFRSNEEDPGAAVAGFARARGSEICGASQIISNIFIQLFRMIIIAELKSSTMLAYENIHGYVMNEDKQEWQKMNSLAREKFEKQFLIYVNIFSLNIAVVDVVYSRGCDPLLGKWIRDDSFYELEKNVQPILFRYNSYNCGHECNQIMSQSLGQCEVMIYRKAFVTNINNTIGECAHLGHIEACLLDSGPHRYQYVNSDILGFLGRNDSCPKDNGRVVKTSAMPTVSYSACQCNYWSSQNKIGLLIIESDVKSNRVITGLRFVRENKVLYIQSRQGELGPNGYIKKYSQRWIDIPKSIHPALIEPINRENRIFFLDDLILPSGFVLTGKFSLDQTVHQRLEPKYEESFFTGVNVILGIKFNKVTREHVTGFAIEIFGTYFDYRTGKLVFSRDSKRSQRESNVKSGKRLLFNAVSSVFTTKTHKVTPSDKKYVVLEPSRLKEDFGQSTLPLFDADPITIGVSSALGGVGIFHKGVEGYAGFISIRIYGIQYEKYFNDFKLSHISNDRVLFNCSSSRERNC